MGVGVGNGNKKRDSDLGRFELCYVNFIMSWWVLASIFGLVLSFGLMDPSPDEKRVGIYCLLSLPLPVIPLGLYKWLHITNRIVKGCIEWGFILGLGMLYTTATFYALFVAGKPLEAMLLGILCFTHWWFGVLRW
jgi:hypothetical protein